MADTKISDLAAATTVIDTDLFPVVTDPGGTPANKKLTLAGLKNSVATAFVQTLLDDADAATARATLDLEPGVDVQTYRTELAALDAAPSSIASAATVDLATATSDSVTITGNTGPITSFGTVAAGRKFHITFESTPQINYNATSMITPYGTANFLATAGDTCWAESLGSGNWRIDYAGRTIKCNSIQVSAGGIATTGAVQADSGSFSTPLPAASGGTGNAFFAVTGPTTSTKTYTIRNATTRIVTAPSALTASVIPYVDANGELVGGTNNVSYGSGILNVEGANGFRNTISGLWNVILDSNATGSAGRLILSIAGGSSTDLLLCGSTQENVFNDTGKAQNFRIETDTLTHALFIDGTNNRLSIGASTNAGYMLQLNGTLNVTGLASLQDNLSFDVVAKGITYKSGTGQRAGNATLVAGTVTVTNTSVTANTVAIISRKTAGGTLGNLTYTLSAGASFTINSDNALDESVVSYHLLEVV